MKKLDLTNQKFGKLLVLYPGEPYIKPSGTKITTWVCQCDCGKQTTVRTEYLRNGHTTSCGCEAHRDDLTNQRFGRLTALELVKNKGWKCLCDCGNITYVRGYNLKSGTTQSCGCLQKERTSETSFKDLTGQRFGQLLVLERYPENNRFGHVQYKCQCDCGNITIVDVTNLKGGHTQSCGCVKSRGEAAINKWLQEHNLMFRPQYSHNDIILSSGRRPFYDFAIFDKNNQLKCLIEYQGIQHYNSGYGWNNEENHQKIVERDREKRDKCQELNVKLYEIPYQDYDNLDEVLTKIMMELELL